MSQDDVYRKLAQRLDETPNGFSATESGVELRLLAKIFAPDEAALAAEMSMTFEPAADIAARVGLDPKVVSRTLKRMVRKELIYFKKGKGQLLFGLMPFAVGFYETQLPNMDVELAELFEQYFQETRGGGHLFLEPPLHRVIPVAEAIAFDVEIFPYEQAAELIKGAKAWSVRDCICRVQRALVGQPCDHPVENCLAFAPVEGAFAGAKIGRAITKEEALQILQEAAEAGLVHSIANHRDEHFYICNCCTCSCGIMRSVAEFGNLMAVAHSDFLAAVEVEECIGCEDCVGACQFGALSVPEDVCVVDAAHCMGCGICVTACPTEALRLERRPQGETAPLPTNLKEWETQRLQARNLPVS
jgi:electron transport complex protein RnfB